MFCRLGLSDAGNQSEERTGRSPAIPLNEQTDALAKINQATRPLRLARRKVSLEQWLKLLQTDYCSARTNWRDHITNWDNYRKKTKVFS